MNVNRSETHAKHSHYWYQIKLFLHQLEGMSNGWNVAVERARLDITLDLEDFLLMNAVADLPDLRVYYENFVYKQAAGMEYHTTPVKASMVVKFLTETGESGEAVPRKVLIGHSSDGHYASMLRMLKRYKFHYNYSDHNKPHQVAGVDITFTGYPGSLASSDDFYVVEGPKNKFVVAGIRIQNANIDLWKQIDVGKSVPLAARVMAANRLAHSGHRWAKVMSFHPGFGTKQWMVVDVGRLHNMTELAATDMLLEKTVSVSGFENGAVTRIEEDTTSRPRTKRDGVIWVVDQLPGRLHGEDMTEKIVYKSGFWTGNGMPYFVVSQTDYVLKCS